MKVLRSILIIAAIASVAFAQDQAPTATADLNPQVMTVNGEPVYAAEISLVMRTIAENLRAGGNEPSQKEILGAATQRVIEQKLLAQEARRFGLQPDEAEVEALLATAAKQVGGRDQLAASLAKGGSSIEQLTEIYREVDLGRILVAKQIRPTVQVTDQEVDDFIARHPDLFGKADGGGAGAAMSPEEVRQRAHEILVNQKAGKLVSDLLKTLYDGASIAYSEQATSSPPPSPSATPDASTW